MFRLLPEQKGKVAPTPQQLFQQLENILASGGVPNGPLSSLNSTHGLSASPSCVATLIKAKAKKWAETHINADIDYRIDLVNPHMSSPHPSFVGFCKALEKLQIKMGDNTDGTDVIMHLKIK